MYGSFFGAKPSATSTNETVTRLREGAELENCWRAQLFIELCPCDPSADPVLLDAFSLVDVDKEPASKKEDSSFDPKKNQYCLPWAYRPSPSSLFFLPPEYKPSDPKSWSTLYRHIQRSGYQSGTQLVCRKTAGKRGDRYVLECFRSKLCGSAH